MSDTATKLTYLNGTKQALKDSINNIGGSITNETTFRAYAEELDTIYDNLPKTTGEGSNLSLTTLKGRINVDDILGDTEQEGTPTPSSPQDINVVTGTQEVVVQNKNYLRLNDIAETTTNGITYSCKNGVISFNGTATSGILIDFQTFNLPSGSYYINRNATGTISGSWQNYLRNSSSNIIQGQGTFTTTESQQVFFRVYFNSGVVCTNYVISPQIELGSSATDFIEHQEQTKTLHLSSSNLCNLSLNTTTIAGVTLTKNSDNTITANGTATSTIAVNILNNNGGTSTDNLTLPKGTYTLSGCPNGGGTSTNYKLDLVRNNGPIITDTGTSATYTATSDIAYSGIRIVIYNGTTCNNLIFKPMLNEGSTALPYEPYYKYELAKIGTYQDRIFETSGKNLFIPTLTNNGSNITQVNASVTLNGDEYTFVASGTDMYLGQVANVNTNYADTKGTLYSIEGGETIYFLLTNTSFKQNFITFYDENKTSLGFTQIQTYTGSATAPTNAKYFSMRIGNSSATSGTTYKTRVMVSKDTISNYEPYGSDKWYIEKNIGKVNLENIPWTGATTASGYKLYATEQIRDIKYVSANTIVGEGLAYNFIMHTGNGMSHPSALNCIAIDINAVRVQTTSQAPTGIFYYALATPTYEEITNETLQNELNELEKMMSYNGQTNISVSGNLPMILDVTALKGGV